MNGISKKTLNPSQHPGNLSGGNEIALEKPRSALMHLLSNIKNPLVFLLLALGVLSFLTGDLRAMVVLGVVLRFFQEMRADNAAEKLKAMRLMYRRHSKLCIIEPCATWLCAVVNTMPRWKRTGHETRRTPFKVSLNMLRFHQIVRPVSSFHALLLLPSNHLAN
jgi:hypothetical protein